MSAFEISAMPESPEKDFELWWYNEGSGMSPRPLEDAEEHTHRVSKIAWLNSFDKATHK
jgi:hypothetical protein